MKRIILNILFLTICSLNSYNQSSSLESQIHNIKEKLAKSESVTGSIIHLDEILVATGSNKLTNESEQSQQLNRRVEVEILSLLEHVSLIQTYITYLKSRTNIGCKSYKIY